MAEIDYGPIIAGMRGGTPGPKGDKGDAGIGFNVTLLGNTDLNTVTTPGIYGQSSTSIIANNASALNYPPNISAAGRGRFTMVVQNWGGSGAVVQIINTIGTLTTPGVTYTRYIEPGYVSSWSTAVKQRVDNNAGRAIYTWDDTQNREQLIYGDTGWRNVKENLLPDFTASSIRIRRTGSMVTVGFDGLTGITSGHATFLPSIAGFAADSTLASAANQRLGPIAELNGANIRWVSPEPGAGALRILSYVANVSMHGFFTYFTADPWPTVLPGIPNGPTSSPA